MKQAGVQWALLRRATTRFHLNEPIFTESVLNTWQIKLQHPKGAWKGVRQPQLSGRFLTRNYCSLLTLNFNGRGQHWTVQITSTATLLSH